MSSTVQSAHLEEFLVEARLAEQVVGGVHVAAEQAADQDVGDQRLPLVHVTGEEDRLPVARLSGMGVAVGVGQPRQEEVELLIRVEQIRRENPRSTGIRRPTPRPAVHRLDDPRPGDVEIPLAAECE